MIRLREEKETTSHKPIEIEVLPLKVCLPLSQHTGKACEPKVKVGDIVRVGDCIAGLDSGLFSPIHASISGKVSAIINWPHPTKGSSRAIVIESDGKDEKNDSILANPKAQTEVDSLSKNELLKIIFESGIVGMGGAGFPAHIKLKPPKPVDTFILNGAECEPYLTCDDRLMVEHADQIIQGMDLVMKVLGIKRGIIAIEENKSEAIEAFKKILHLTPYTLHILKARYPQGGEKQVIETILRRQVPSGGLPFDIGVVVHNAATVFAIYEAVFLNKPLYERVVTVTGDCLENPKNLRVRLGTPLKELIAACGPLKEEPLKVIVGGPMMGIAQGSLDAPVIKTTSGVILFSQKHVRLREDRVCCRCGRCIDECPVRIMPALITMAAEKDNFQLAKEYDVFDCIECGICSYVCPAKRDLVHLIKYAKSRLSPQ